MPITGPQVRAARAFLGWTQGELAAKANVAARTIRLFENEGSRPYAQTIEEIQKALEQGGIAFLSTDAGLGVLLTAEPSAAHQ